MTLSVLITVRFHEGRYHGQEDRFNGEDGWPPSPGRLFQALVAGAAQGGELRADDERALKWLERLGPPTISAPAVRRGRSVKFYVPSNDLDAKGGDPDKSSDIRVLKRWRPCFFNPCEPVLYVWDFKSGETKARRVCAIAERLYQLGRGIDMAWATGEILEGKEVEARLESHLGAKHLPLGTGKIAIPAPGTLDSLVNRHRSKRQRLKTGRVGQKSRQLFAQPPKASFGQAGYDTLPHRLHFELRRSSTAFAARPLRSVAPLISGLRDAAANRLCKALPDKSALFERLIIGRNAGPADLTQRIRLIPMPSIGAPHTDPSVRRIMIEIPPDCPIRKDDLKWAFAGLRPCDPSTGEVWAGSLTSTDDSRIAIRFAQPGRVFRSMSPVALTSAQRRRITVGDKKTAEERSREERQVAGAVVQALRHAGIRCKPFGIRVQKEPFHRLGIRADLFAEGSRFSKNELWHVELQFDRAISGPLVIGNGRFCGLGLMEPVPQRTDVFAVKLHSGQSISSANRHVIVRHLRRALMALARNNANQVGRLFSGHESNGHPDSAGHHAHVFLAAERGLNDEDAIKRLIVAAPWAVDRRAKRPHGAQRQFEDVVRQLESLRAGFLGKFDHLKAEPVEDGDPLLGPASVWTGKTPYVATRNLKKRDDPATVIKTDVATECARRGLPTPVEVHAQDVSAGPRGGRPTARLELRFAVAVRGPLLLGRDSHSGGGLFVAPTNENSGSSS